MSDTININFDDIDNGDIIVLRRNSLRTSGHSDVATVYAPSSACGRVYEVIEYRPRELKIGDKVADKFTPHEGVLVGIDGEHGWIKWKSGGHGTLCLSSLKRIP